MTRPDAVPCAGLQDPVHDAQRAFRVALDALSRPGRVLPLGAPVEGLPLGPALAHLLLALTDEDTPVWWQQQDAGLARWLRFHTGAPVAATAGQARFAVVTDPLALPPLEAFDPGTLESPEHSCTLLLELPALAGGAALQAHGPGIRDQQTLAPSGLPTGFWSQWQANHAGFPQGVDLFLTCGAEVLGLPRTTRIRRLEGL